MFRGLQYVFYRILDWKTKSPRESQPLLVAMLATTVLIWVNVFSIVGVVEHFSGWRILLGNHARNALITTIIAGIYLILQRLWIASGRYKSFSAEFSAETDARRKRNLILVWVYIVGTALFPFVLVAAWANKT